MTPFVLSSAAQLNKADPAFDPSTFASNLLLERPHEQLVVLGREQLEHLVVYTIDVTAQALLLVFLGGTAQTLVEGLQQRADGRARHAASGAEPLSHELLELKATAAALQSKAVLWLQATVHKYLRRAPQGFVTSILNRLFFIGSGAEHYFGAKVRARSGQRKGETACV